MIKHAYMVVGLGYGDEGKGTMVDYLTVRHGANWVVRFSGGPQCGHNVITDAGTHHTFAQFGSGTLNGAKTYYGRFALFEPFALFREAQILCKKINRDPLQDFYVEEGALVITPYHWIANRLREQARGAQAHGTCGMGIGEARMDQLDNQPMITADDLRYANRDSLYRKLRAILSLKVAQMHTLGVSAKPLIDEDMDDLLDFYIAGATRLNIVPNGTLHHLIDGTAIFEGNQGVLLDEKHGSFPHCTWTSCTFDNAFRTIASEMPVRGVPVTRIGVTRTYLTRHGAGPFPSENPNLDWEEPHNREDGLQGKFRRGYLNMDSLSYSVGCCGGLDAIALTHADQYELRFAGGHVQDLMRTLREHTGVAVQYLSDGPMTRNKKEL